MSARKGSHMLRLSAFAVLLMAVTVQAGTPTYTTRRVTAVVSNPVFVCQAPDDNDRLFIVQQGGQIRIFNLATNTLSRTNFLSMSGITAGGEEGLLGLAFHPDYATTSPYFYVYFHNSSGNLQINCYTRSTSAFHRHQRCACRYYPESCARFTPI